MNLSERLNQVADLLEKGLTEQNPTKTASALPETTSDAKTSIQLGIYVNYKKASYLDLFKELSNGGYL